MSKKNFERVMAGLEDALAFVEGRADPAAYRVHVPEVVDVKAIRTKLGLTQPEFAARFGFSTGAVRDWEQKRKQPEASARILLKIIEHEPEAVKRALEAA
jgi:putative transcriptional regulator